MRLTPAFGRPLPHRGQWHGPVLCTLFAGRRSTLQDDVAFLRVSPSPTGISRSDLATGEIDYLPALEIDQGERSEGVTFRSTRKIVGIVHRKLIH